MKPNYKANKHKIISLIELIKKKDAEKVCN
jgi:hypothetical protein